LKSKKSGLFSSKIKWNFTKFLIDRNGEVLRRFSPATSPKKIEKIIASLINNK
jgi:glutathione peroxidase